MNVEEQLGWKNVDTDVINQQKIQSSVGGDKKKLSKNIKSKRRDIIGVAPLVDENGNLQSKP